MAELLFSATPPGGLTAISSTGFLTGADAGYFDGGVVSIPGIAPGADAFLSTLGHKFGDVF